MRIADEQLMAAVAGLSSDRFTVLDVGPAGEHQMLLRFQRVDESEVDGPKVYGVRLALPSSSATKPWLDNVPTDAAEAAVMLARFLEEGVDTSLSGARLSTEAGTQMVELVPYGFRSADESRHRKLLRSAGPNGWRDADIQENDDRTQTPGAKDAARRRGQSLTYTEVGATSGSFPDGYRQIDITRVIGQGRDWFHIASERLLSWDMHRRAGLLVATDPPTAVSVGDVPVLGFVLASRWVISAPVRVLEVIREPTVAGFAYGTLPGMPTQYPDSLPRNDGQRRNSRPGPHRAVTTQGFGATSARLVR